MQRHDAALFRASALPLSAATAVVAVVAAVRAGRSAAIDAVVGAALGGALVAAFFGADHLLSARTRRTEPVAVMGLALFAYLLKITLLALLLVLFRDTTLFSTGAFAAALLVGTVVWLAAQVRAFGRRRMLSVEPADPAGVQPGKGAQ